MILLFFMFAALFCLFLCFCSQDLFASWFFDFTILFCTFSMCAWGIRVIYLIDKNQKEARNPVAVQNARRERERQERDFLINTSLRKIDVAIANRDFDEVLRVVDELIQQTDDEKYALERHFLISKVANKLFSIRAEEPNAAQLCLVLCRYDFENMPFTIRKINGLDTSTGDMLDSPSRLYTPSLAATVLEKNGDIAGAIEVCNMAIGWNALDLNGFTFRERKERLEKALAD